MRSIRLALFVALAATFAVAPSPRCAESGPASPTPQTPPPASAGGASTDPSERPVGTEDLIEISVFEIPELNRTVRVGENGKVSLPLLGEVQAGGLTPRQLEMSLRDRLGEKYVQNPQVSVFVRENGSKRVSVLGAVGKPGVYEMLGPRSLLQVLALAGGLTSEAGAELYVIRLTEDGRSERTVVDVADLLASRDPVANLRIEPSDVVSVPIERAHYVYVDGAVKSPGRIDQPASRPLTLLQAIAKCGGATERANLKKIQILRRSPDGTQRGILVDVRKVRKGLEADPVLQDGDVVIVQETFF